MKLAGRVWNTLPADERRKLLRNCTTKMTDGIIEHESTLSWDKLWPKEQP